MIVGIVPLAGTCCYSVFSCDSMFVMFSRYVDMFQNFFLNLNIQQVQQLQRQHDYSLILQILDTKNNLMRLSFFCSLLLFFCYQTCNPHPCNFVLIILSNFSVCSRRYDRYQLAKELMNDYISWCVLMPLNVCRKKYACFQFVSGEQQLQKESFLHRHISADASS